MSEQIYLREISKDDIRVINSWRSNRELIDKLGTGFRYIDKSVDDAWFESYLKNRSSNIRLAVCEQPANNIVGVVYLLGIDWVNRNCEFAIMIGEGNNRGKGIGKYATTQALLHAFKDLNLHRVNLTVMESNKTALSLYKKIGFKVEGVLRDSVYKSGSYHNMVAMALLRSDFQD